MNASGAPAAPILILLGSARGDGDTAGAACRLAAELGPGAASLVDLAEKRIRGFNYAEPAPDDDFHQLADLMVAHQDLVFATPVYWYAMSGVMKVFFDRLSDLLSDRDPSGRGRRLRGRRIWLLAVGSDPVLPGGFEQPFARTADYLGMDWRGAFYVRSGSHRDERQLEALAAALRAPAAGLK